MEGKEGNKVQDTPPSPMSNSHGGLGTTSTTTMAEATPTTLPATQVYCPLCDGLMDWMTKEWFCVIVMFCWPLPSTGLPSLCHMMDGTGYPVAPQSRVRLSPLYTCKAPWGRISNWGKTGEEGTLDWGLIISNPQRKAKFTCN